MLRLDKPVAAHFVDLSRLYWTKAINDRMIPSFIRHAWFSMFQWISYIKYYDKYVQYFKIYLIFTIYLYLFITQRLV